MADFDIVQEPKGDVLRRLIVAAAESCDRFTLERSRINWTGRATNVLASLTPYLIGCEQTSETPGSILPWGRTITLCTYRLTSEAADILAGATERLYDWVEPDLPQDLCFLRGSRPWLINLASDREAIIDMSREEADALRLANPGLKLRERPLDRASIG